MELRSAAISGSTGAQQRLRYGLGEFRPYRWHGRPGWNPARVLDGWRSTDRMARECGYCGAPPGEHCRTRSGRVIPRTTHGGR